MQHSATTSPTAHDTRSSTDPSFDHSFDHSIPAAIGDRSAIHLGLIRFGTHRWSLEPARTHLRTPLRTRGTRPHLLHLLRLGSRRWLSSCCAFYRVHANTISIPISIGRPMNGPIYKYRYRPFNATRLRFEFNADIVPPQHHMHPTGRF
jgi:hypothetical protein